MNERSREGSILAGGLGAVLILAVLGLASWLDAADDDLFYRVVQEDEILEWATFWAFMLAAGVNGGSAWLKRRAEGGLPWFLAGLAAFCFLVAMEEISWGQRVFGYRPPAYFLEYNFQQEFNLHNVVESSVRKLVLRSVIVGYGIVLPLVALVPLFRRLLERVGIHAPPLLLAAGFAGMQWATLEYPWDFTNEFVELMLGMGFLFAAVTHWRTLTPRPPKPGSVGALLTVAVSALVTFGLGAANAGVSRIQRASSAAAVEQTGQEIEALQRDILAAGEGAERSPVRCKVHKRIYTFAEKYDSEFLYEGEYAGLVQQGLPQERAEFFLDPWNYAYWIRTTCRKSQTEWKVFIYSFGPNQRRDSSRWELGGDDIGFIFEGRGTPGEQEGQEATEGVGDS